MKKLILFLVLAICFAEANGQTIIVNGCRDVSGSYNLSGTDASGRNIYTANHFCPYCSPQEISYSSTANQWELKSKSSWSLDKTFAYNTDQSFPDPPLTGWVNSPWMGNACPNMTISLPVTIESKNCSDCHWSNPDTWLGGVVPGESNHVTINGQVILDADASVLNFRINTSKSLTKVNDKSLTIKGNYENNGFLNVNRLELTLEKPHILDGTKVNLQRLNVYGDVTLSGNLEVLAPEVTDTDNVYLYHNATITLGNYDLTCQGVNIGIPGSQLSRVITNGTGALKFKVPAGFVYKGIRIGIKAYDASTLPYQSNLYGLEIVGNQVNTESNLPVTISVHLSEFSPTHLLPENTNVIPMVWNISSDFTTAQGFNLVFGWNTHDTPSGFNLNNMYIKRWNGTNWDNKEGPVSLGGYSGVGHGAWAYNITEFSTWAIFDSETVLPVTLASFDVKPENGTALLTWETTEESNSSHFEIEHSGDARTWKQVGKVRSAGESRELARYSFNHGSPGKKHNYYRLKMVDLDGSRSYSPVKTLFFNSPANDEIYLYPNPVAGRLFLKDKVSEISSLSVISQSGQKMIPDTPYSENGISLEALPPGTYLVNIKLNDGSRISRKLLISK